MSCQEETTEDFRGGGGGEAVGTRERALSLLSTDAERMVGNHRVSLAQNHQEHGF